MPVHLQTYTAYSVERFIEWAVVWILVFAIDPASTQKIVGWVFLGWMAGWLSATFARRYPPPSRWSSSS